VSPQISDANSRSNFLVRMWRRTRSQRTVAFSALDFPVLRSWPSSKLTLSPCEPPRCNADTVNEHVRSSIGSNDSGSSSQSTSEARSSGTANSLTREPSLPAGVETVHLLAIADAHVPMVDEARAFVEHRRPPDAGKNGRVRSRRYAGEQPVASAAIRLVKGDWPAGLAEGQLFPSPCQPAGHAGSVRSYQASATSSAQLLQQNRQIAQRRQTGTTVE